jgi:hypothetical protein
MVDRDTLRSAATSSRKRTDWSGLAAAVWSGSSIRELPSITPPKRTAGRRTEAASGIDLQAHGCLFCFLLVRLECLQQELAQPILRNGVVDKPQQREAATVTTDGEVARWQHDVAAFAVAAFPSSEVDQAQATEIAAGEMEFRLPELAWR